MVHADKLPSRQDRLLPFKEMLPIIGVCRSKAYLLMAEGGFPTPVKIGRNSYFSELELQAWIAARLDARVIGGAS